MTSGLTTKGPMPIMSIMLRATASFRPRPRTKPGSGVALPGAEVDFVLASGSEAGFCGGVIGPQRIANGRHSSYKIKGKIKGNREHRHADKDHADQISKF